MTQEKKIYYSDLANYVDVCYSCKSQNINVYNHYDDGRESSCNDCNSPGYFVGLKMGTTKRAICPAGSFCPNSTSQLFCPAGKFGNVDGMTTIADGCSQNCSDGALGFAGATNCAACPLGKYGGNGGCKACKPACLILLDHDYGGNFLTDGKQVLQEILYMGRYHLLFLQQYDLSPGTCIRE